MQREVRGLVLNYRDAIRTVRCVRSLLASGVNPVMVWDNSCDEGESGRSVAKAFKADSRVLLRSRNTNLGFAAGVNAGLAESCALAPRAWVLLINNDAVFPLDLLPKMIAALEADVQAIVAFPRVRQSGRLQTWLHYQRWLGLITRFPALGTFPYASGCCQLIATDRLSPPLYDESFFMYGEDVELSWRLSRAGLKIILVDGTPVEHEGSASSGPNTPFYETQLVTSHILLGFRLSGGPIEAALLLLLRVPTLLSRALVRSVRYGHVRPLVGYVTGLREAFRVLKASGRTSINRRSP